MNKPASVFILLAEAFRYPAPGHFEALENAARPISAGREKDLICSFLNLVRPLSLGAWEELHTRTLDLNPPAAPYIGFQTWGESYQRGEFMSKMNAALMQAEIDAGGELPDHLTPVFRYLAQTRSPLPELVDVLDPALQRMRKILREADADNPYLDLFEAAHLLARQLKKEPA